MVADGAGFIGSNVVDRFPAHHDEAVVDLAALSCAGNPDNFAKQNRGDRHIVIDGSITDPACAAGSPEQRQPRAFFNFPDEDIGRSSPPPAPGSLSVGTVTVASDEEIISENGAVKFKMAKIDATRSVKFTPFVLRDTKFNLDPLAPMKDLRPASDHDNIVRVRKEFLLPPPAKKSSPKVEP